MIPFSRPMRGWPVLLLVVASPAQSPPSFLERAKMTSSDTNAIQLAYVAISGDTVAVGDDNYRPHGAVLVFEKSASGWASSTQPAVLTASDGGAGEQFGRTLAIDGDTIVVGAAYHHGFGSGNGAVYVYEKPAGGWEDMTETVKFGPCCAVNGYSFGSSVAIEGDTLVIGADQRFNLAQSPGGAHVFQKPAGASWLQGSEVARFAASDPVGEDWFGSSVAVRGDLIAVGARLAFRGGAVYVFEKPAGGWVTKFETAKLTVAGSTSAAFGESVAIGDAYVAGGASWTNNRRGAVYVFERPPTGWSSATQTATLTTSGGVDGDFLGASIDCEGDRIIAGAAGNSLFAGQYPPGAVHVFDRPAQGWVDANEDAKLQLGPRNTQASLGTMFGNRVSLDQGTMAATSLWVLPKGAAYVFEEPPVAPNSGCGLSDTALSGSTRIGGTFEMRVASCAGGGAPEFLLGVPLAQPFAFAPPVSCTGASPCLLSCNPVIRILGPSLSLTWANDPSLVGISLCIQGLCLDLTAPCLEISDQATVTITS